MLEKRGEEVTKSNQIRPKAHSGSTRYATTLYTRSRKLSTPLTIDSKRCLMKHDMPYSKLDSLER